MSKILSKTLTKRILIGMVLGLALGFFIRVLPDSFIVVSFFKDIISLIGDMFMRAIMMLVVPVVFVSIVSGSMSLSGSNLGRMGGLAFFYYLLTTAVAISIAMALAWFFGLGNGANLIAAGGVTSAVAPTWQSIILSMIPDKPLLSLVNGHMLPLIVFALILGVSMGAIRKRVQVLSEFFDQAQALLIFIINSIMRFAPIGVSFLLAKVAYDLSFVALSHLLAYFFTLLLALFLQCFVTYAGLIKFVAKLSPYVFFKKMKTVMLFAFGVSSSTASIPLMLTTMQEKLGISKKISSFIVPLGATVNMDGTAMMQGVATVFIAHAYGVSLSLVQYLTVIAMATLASIGTAGVPSVGLITLVMVLKQVGLPTDGIAIIMGVDRLLDMTRTAVNIAGDATVNCLVGKHLNEIDRDCYNSLSNSD